MRESENSESELSSSTDGEADHERMVLSGSRYEEVVMKVVKSFCLCDWIAGKGNISNCILLLIKVFIFLIIFLLNATAVSYTIINFYMLLICLLV